MVPENRTTPTLWRVTGNSKRVGVEGSEAKVFEGMYINDEYFVIANQVVRILPATQS